MFYYVCVAAKPQNRLINVCLHLPSFGFTKPLVTPRLWAATVSPLTTRSKVNSEDSVCMTIGRSRSRTWGWTRNKRGEYYYIYYSQHIVRLSSTFNTIKWGYRIVLNMRCWKSINTFDNRSMIVSSRHDSIQTPLASSGCCVTVVRALSINKTHTKWKSKV